MKIKKLLCAAVAVSAFIFPSIAKAEVEKAYMFTPVENETETSITLYEYDKDTQVLKETHNELTLNKTTYGSGDASTTVDVVIPNNKTQTITINYDSANVVSARQTISSDKQEITGTFKDISSSNSGGAIYNSAIINEIIGVFEGNSSNYSGGAIYNNGQIALINSIFINNACATTNYGFGGAIYNSGEIDSIIGDFIGNYTAYNYSSSYSNGYGGAIYNSGVINSITANFINNRGGDNGSGGAISNEDSAHIGIIVGDFIGNLSSGMGGGAIYNYSSTIESIIGDFVNNIAGDNGEGGAIFNYSAVIENITGNFIGNTSKSGGGAIYNFQGTIKSIEGDFIGNSTTSTYSSGGAIYNYHKSIIESIKGDFINNSSNNYGGAIYNDSTSYDDTTSRIDYIEGNFISNYAKSDGGAIYNTSTAPIKSIKGDFKENSSGSDGGAIYNYYNSTIELLSGDFIENTAILDSSSYSDEIYGGAIYNAGTINLINGNFISNSVSKGSSTSYGSGIGGAIYNTGTIDEIIGDFEDNSSSYSGGAIYNSSTSPIKKIVGDFVSNSAGGSGGAIYNSYYYSSSDSSYYSSIIEYIEGDFINNTSGSSGGAICNGGIINIEMNNFIGNSADVSGGAVSNSGTISSLEGDFIGNSSGNAGGAFYNSSAASTEYISGDFINNYAGGDGGAIYNHNSTIKSITSKFEDNIANGNGGAIYNSSGNIENITTNFTNNKANGFGGAIYNGVYYSGTSVIENITSDFINNTAGVSGGAIYNGKSASISAIKSNFTNNTVNIENISTSNVYGGAIYNSGTIDTIEGDFLENSITSTSTSYSTKVYGGAIYNEGTIGSIDGDFTNNSAISASTSSSAEVYGGAIYNSGTITSIESNFADNIAGELGGAIYNNSQISLINSSFENNTAESGGAIYNNGQITSIYSSFENNTAEYGGAIYNNSSATIENITGDFINNSAEYSGGAILNYGTMNIANSDFKNNSADRYGGAIYNSGTLNISATEKDIEFTGNTVNGESNAIKNNNTIYLSTSNGYKIYLNDAIFGYGNFNINGEVILNNTISENNVILNEGTLKLTENGNFNKNASLMLNENGTLNILDNEIKEYTVISIKGNNGNMAIDLDTETNTADNFVLYSSSGTINLSNINLLNSPAKKEGKIQILKKNNNSGTIDSNFTFADIYTSDGKVIFEDLGNGYIYYDTHDRTATNFQNMVKFVEGDRVYVMTEDESITRHLDTMMDSSLIVNGNGYIVDGNDYRGIDVEEGQKLSLNNLSVKNFKAEYNFDIGSDSEDGGFLYNRGTIENISGTIEGNSAYASFIENWSINAYGGAIYNKNLIENIVCDFIENSVNADSVEQNSYVYGGAIYNNSLANIESIEGNFEKNSANANSVEDSSIAYGGAIYNAGKISSITGKFNNNSANANSNSLNVQAAGGAIYNTGELVINADFLNNSLTANSTGSQSYLRGGAIHNSGTIYKINGNFENNFISTKRNGENSYDSAYGAAIYNESVITNIASDFINNSIIIDLDLLGATFEYNYSNYINIYGGAIFNAQSSSIDNLIGDFSGNNINVSVKNPDGGNYHNAGGGALSNWGTIGNIIGDFENNKVTMNISGYTRGGAIYNEGTINAIEGDFSTNSASYGGAIYNEGTISTIESNFYNTENGGAIYNKGTINSIAGNFNNNNSGAIYNIGTISSINGNFEGNSASNGGAIYNEKGTININANFINNIASNNGGAIYNGKVYEKAIININAIENDIEFTGNIANGKSNAIYNNYGIVNFNTDNGHKIYMNDGILSNGGSININGELILNNIISGGEIVLNDGILKLAENGNFDKTTNLTLNENSILDAIDNNIKEYVVYNLNSNNGNFAIDVDLSTDVSDSLYVSYGYYSPSSKSINLSNINILNLVEGKEGKIQIIKNGQNFILNPINIYTSAGQVYFEDAGNGYIYYDTHDRTAQTFQNIVKFIDGDRIYCMDKDEIITRNLDSMAGTSLIVNGNGFTVDGNGYRGIDVANGQTLSINNVVAKNFKAEQDANNYNWDNQNGGFISNNGTIENISGSFENNSANNDGGAIYNNYDGEINTISGIFKNNISEYSGGAIYNNSNINSINGDFENNIAEYDGGAIYNSESITSLSGTFKNNSAEDGGAINNDGSIETINGSFDSNLVSDCGGAIANYGEVSSISGNFINNSAIYSGGAIINNGIIDSINGSFVGNKSSFMGGAIHNDFGLINNLSGTFENNSSLLGGAIMNMQGFINISANEQNTSFTGNKDLSGSSAIANILGVVNLNANTAKSIIFNDAIGTTVDDYINLQLIANPDYVPSEEEIAAAREEIGMMLTADNNLININANKEQIKPSIKKYMLLMDGMTEEDYEQLSDEEKAEFDSYIEEASMMVNLPEYTTGTIEINNKVKNSTVNMYDGTLKFGTNTQDGIEYVGGFNNDVNFNFFGGNVTLQNEGINSANLGNMTLHNEMNLSLDADLAKETIDTISVDSFVSNDNKINITNINLLSATDKKELSLSPLSTDMDSAVRQTIADSIIYSGGDVAYGNIYKYTVDYDSATANLNFGLQNNGNSLNDFAPSVVVNPIAQNGTQSVQLDSFTEVFRNMDMFMLMPENERLAYKYQNKYADSNANFVYDPTMTAYQNNTAWFRPYTTFENIPLKNGPKVSNVKYGTYFGYDSAIHELGKGWDGTFGIYAGYNGSHQSFNGNSIYQNGGTLGLIGVAYKGNFFTGWTANIGATAGSTNSIQGEDNFTALMGGISTKNGYNFEFAEGKFIIQPSVMLSYSLVNMFDYTAASGARMKSEPYHTIQLEPGIKFIGNIGTWQPYANVSMVWNMLNEQKITADNVQLPKVNIKPYVKYGVGLQKKWADKFTAFGQVYVTNGGRNGVGLQAGLRVALGDETTKSKAAWLTPKKKDTVIVLDGKVK